MRRATPASATMRMQAARGQAGPSPPLVMQVAATVTPCRHDADSTVLCLRRQRRADPSAGFDGDVGCTYKIPVRLELAVWTAEPSGSWLRDPTPAGKTRRRGASLVHEPHLDSGELCLVAQGLHQMGAVPLAKSPVLHPACIRASDAAKIANSQDSYPMLDSKGDHLPGRRVVRLANSPTVAGLIPSFLEPVAAPAA